MNNTAQDCRPYILSADHCIAGVSESGLEQSIALINYENKNCNADVSQSDVALTGLKNARLQTSVVVLIFCYWN